jgi:RNA polymerase sigma-70 factor (ECF subfamily)
MALIARMQSVGHGDSPVTFFSRPASLESECTGRYNQEREPEPLDREAEIELARQLLAGETGAFERFVDHFRAKIFHYSWLMCGQREDAEEVAQETLLKVFENFHQLREPERVRPWVFRVAKNACLMKRRKSVFAPAAELSLDELMPARSQRDGAVAIEIADWSRLPEDELLKSELKAVLHSAIDQLPELYKSVLLLRDLEELSTEETAQVLDIKEDAVKTRLHRARLAIRKLLDERLRAVPAGGSHGSA